MHPPPASEAAHLIGDTSRQMIGNTSRQKMGITSRQIMEDTSRETVREYILSDATALWTREMPQTRLQNTTEDALLRGNETPQIGPRTA